MSRRCCSMCAEKRYASPSGSMGEIERQAKHEHAQQERDGILRHARSRWKYQATRATQPMITVG